MQEKITPLLKAQDATAIELLLDHYGGSLFGVILRIVHNHELAEQVMQDTFLKAWQHGAKYDESKGRLFTWLLNIARNTAIDATRTGHFQRSQLTEDITPLTHEFAMPRFNIDTIDLRKAVGNLEEKYRLLIEMVYFSEYTQQETADHLDIPLGTIKTRLRYAILALRKLFA